MKAAIGIVVALAGIALVMYLAGFLFLAMNKINPLEHAALLTWLDYYRIYPDSRPQLHKAGLLSAAVVGLLVVAGYIKRNKLALHGESRFASLAEIKAAGLMKNTGVIVGKAAGRFLMFATQQSISLFAPTRSGKDTGVVIPNLLGYPESVVVHDLKVEAWAITSKYRSEQGQAVYLFNPFSTETHRYNPLGYVSDDPHRRPAEVLSIGYMLYPRGDDRNSMWSDTARDLFVGLCLYMLETPSTVASIGEALRIASGKGKPLKHHLTDLIHSRNFDAIEVTDDKGQSVTRYVPKKPYDGTGLPYLSANCVDSLNRFVAAPDNTAGGILTTFNAPLTLWASPIVDAATSDNDFDLRQIRKRRMSVYIGIPAKKLSEAGVVLRLFFSQLFELNMDHLAGTEGNNVPCLLVLNELAAMGYMPILDKAPGYMAGYGLRMLLVAQSKAQLTRPISEGGYGSEGAQAMLTNTALSIMYTPKDITDANEYSEILGFNTVKSQSRNLRNRLQGTESDQKRALMLPQELMRMSQEKQLIQLEGVRPIKCGKIRYYKEPVFIDRLKSVSPALARLGKKLPTEEQLQAAWPELSAPVPSVNVDLFQAKCNDRKRPMTSTDVAGGVSLESVVIDLSGIKAPETDPMSDDDVKTYVDQFWSALDQSGALDNTARANVDLETGEWIEPDNDRVDLNILQQA